MEAIGLTASIIGIIELTKKLNDVTLTLAGKLPKLAASSSTVLTQSILRDLEALDACLKARGDKLSLQSSQELCDACSTLELSLSGCLSKCNAISAHFNSGGMTRIKAVLHGHTTANFALHLKKIEKEVSNLRWNFTVKGLTLIELSTIHSLNLTERFREEVHQRLDFIEDHLQFRIAKAEANPISADALVGVSRMSGLQVITSLDRANKDLEKPATALEMQYLRLKVQTLQDALRQVPQEYRIDERDGSRFEGEGGTHRYPTDNPSQQVEDAILQTIQLLQTLRRSEKSRAVSFLTTVICLEDLAKQMLDLGMYEDARQTYTQVVHMYRASIRLNSPASVLDAGLARAIIGVCAALQRLGEAQEAMHLVQEAVLIYRFLANEAPLPWDYKPELSIALNNMANYTRDSGKVLDAIPLIAEAVQLREELAARMPDVYKADLAASLLNASTCSSKLPCLHRQALDFAERAVDISWLLDMQTPGKYNALLGAALHNRAIRRMVLSKYTEGYNDIIGAVQIRRNLASSRPDVYGGGLIRSLSVAKSLADHCGDAAAADAIEAEVQTLLKRPCDRKDIPVTSTITVRPYVKEGPSARYKIYYRGSGDLATPYFMASASTCIDHVISARCGLSLRP